MTRIIYKVWTEHPTQEHELKVVSSHNDLGSAQSALALVTSYGRIEKHFEEYTPAPAGREYKDEEYGWSSYRDSEVIEEN